MAQKLKHDRYLDGLCEKLEHQYDRILKNVPLYRNKRRIAEIDVLAIKDSRYDVYEVKCSYRPTKAKKQLKRIRKLMPNIDNTFFFCGESGLLQMI